MSTRTIWFAGAAAVCFAMGVVLSQQIEPRVRVQKVMFAGDTPALQFIPAGSGPHPVALLAHGYTASKETLFCYGEALAAAGFMCFDVDLPGHGASPRPYSFLEAVRTLEEIAHAAGPVDVFVGHSMGGFAGGEAVREGGMKPRLFIAVGSLPHLGEHAPPLLLLAGRFDEIFPPALLKARTDARLVLSAWSEHGLEAYDPVLVKAAVESACAAVGKTPPAAQTRWAWRLAGGLLTILGALGLALCLPKLPARWAWGRGPLVSAIYFVAFVLSTRIWLDATPHLREVPAQAAAIIATFLVLQGAGRLRLPRWSFLALAVVVWFGWVVTSVNIRLINMPQPGITAFRLALFVLSVPALFVGTMLGWIAGRRGTRCDGDIAMAIIVGCTLFHWGQPPRKAPEAPASHVAIKLDTKLLDACVGRYEFAPDNVFPTGMKLTIWRQGDQLAGQWSGLGVFQDVVHIYPESEINFFLTINGRQNREQLNFVKNDKGDVTEVIDQEPGLPVFEGKKL